MKCTPWHAVVQALQAEGVEYVFGFPGDPRHLVSELGSQSMIKFILVRHEASAVSTAYSYARVTGNPGNRPPTVDATLTEALRENAVGKPVTIDCHTARHDYPEHFVAVHKQKHGSR